MVLIREATPNDATQLAPLILNAIGDIAHRLTNKDTDSEAVEGLVELVQAIDNRHSYLNTYVAELADQVVGMIVLYDGLTGNKLDALHAKKYNIQIDVEAHNDEFYIDTVSVLPSAQGKGVGSRLLQFAEEKAKENGFSKISLNVEIEKTNAQKLYERLGFVVTEPWTIIDEPFHHMVKMI